MAELVERRTAGAARERRVAPAARS